MFSLPWWLSNPIVNMLKDHLLATAEETIRTRYIERGVSPEDDLKGFNREVRQLVDTWLSEERHKIKLATGEYKRIVTGQTREALESVLSHSNTDWYSIERDDEPMILAVPYNVLRSKTLQALPSFLKAKIQFKDMRDETLYSFSQHAIETYFEGLIYDSKKHYEIYNIMDSKSIYPQKFFIIDVIKDDFYHIGNENRASRVDMVIFSDYDYPYREEDTRRNQRNAHNKWKEIKSSGRPDNRRFTGEEWDLPESLLRQLASRN